MIIIYTTCSSKSEAKKIGLSLLKKRLAACFVVLPGVVSFYFWPPKRGKIARSKEAILLVKTTSQNFSKIAKEVKSLHSYTTPIIASIPVAQVNKDYLKWLWKEVK